MEDDIEFEFGMTNLILDDKDEDKASNNLIFEEEFLKPTKIVYDVEPEPWDLTQKKQDPPEIRFIKFQRKEPNEESLFTATKLLYDDELDNSQGVDDEFLFKPVELLYEDPLEIFNKRREQTKNINPLKPVHFKEEKPEEEEIKIEIIERTKEDDIKEDIKNLILEEPEINNLINDNKILNITFDKLKELQLSLKKESSLKKLCKNIFI